jgi:hypothetical protein
MDRVSVFSGRTEKEFPIKNATWIPNPVRYKNMSGMSMRAVQEITRKKGKNSSNKVKKWTHLPRPSPNLPNMWKLGRPDPSQKEKHLHGTVNSRSQLRLTREK